jgi:hypothetical protein
MKAFRIGALQGPAKKMSNMLSRDESVEQLDFALKSAGMGV